MKQHLNTLFVTTDGAYLAREGQNILVRATENEQRVTKLRVPVLSIGGKYDTMVTNLLQNGYCPSCVDVVLKYAANNLWKD